MTSLSLEFEMLSKAKTIAVVGLSPDPNRSSYGVAEYIQRFYSIIPINPNIETWNGMKAYSSLLDVPQQIDIVNVFRRSEETPEIVRQAVSKKVKGIWLQQGVISEEAKKIAESAGIPIVMDACIAVVHSQIKSGI